MKKHILIVGLAGLLGISSGLTSCAPDYETDFNVEHLVVPDKSQAPLIFPLSGGEEKVIEVETNVPSERWQAQSNAEWCVVVKQENKVLVTATANSGYKQRLAEITIAYGHQSYSIKVSQFGLEPCALVEGQQNGYIKNVDAEDKAAGVRVSTNLNLDNIIVPDTCEWVRLEKPAAPGTRVTGLVEQDLKFTLDQNTDTVVRYCTVILQSSQNYNYTASFLIKQQKRGYIIEIDDAKKNFTVESTGETIIVPFKGNGPSEAYRYTIEESAKSWIVPVPVVTRGMRELSESFVVKANILEKPRTGHITFVSTDPTHPNQFTVTVNQEKFIPVPPFCVKNVVATPGAGYIKLNWEMPEKVNFTSMKIGYYDPLTKGNKEIEVDNNITTSLIIEDTYKCAGEYSFTVKTYGPTGMETKEPATVKSTSNESVIKVPVSLTVDMLSANATQNDDGGGLPALLDGNKTTYYHSLWGAISPNSQAHYIQFNMKELPLQSFCFEYDGRNVSNNGGDVKRAGIWGSDTGTDGSWLKIGTETFPLPTTAGGHSAAKENVTASKSYKYIRFTPEACRRVDPLNPTNTNNAWFNMSNIYLYKINKHDEAWAKKELGL